MTWLAVSRQIHLVPYTAEGREGQKEKKKEKREQYTSVRDHADGGAGPGKQEVGE